MAASSVLKKARRSAGVSAARRISRSRRHFRLRKKVLGTAERPRLVVTRSARHLFVQLVDGMGGTGNILATGCAEGIDVVKGQTPAVVAITLH